MSVVKKDQKPKIIVILGPTASGKTSLGVKLAHDLNGEIISADSRQVYRGMDIGTGKDLLEYNYKGINIPYHLIDVASPLSNFNLARYQKLAIKKINEVLKKKKLPIIVGGTGLYLQAIVDNYKLSDLKSNREMRDKLEKLGAEKLYKMLEKLNADFASRINHSDKHNPRRLSRYLELIKHGDYLLEKRAKPIYDFLILGKKISDKQMREKIVTRLDHRIDKEGMIEEIKSLRESGISYQRLISFGLEYKYTSYFLQGKLDEEKMREKLKTAIYRFAKKQKTWFKRWENQGKEINWIKDYNQALKVTKKYLDLK